MFFDRFSILWQNQQIYNSKPMITLDILKCQNSNKIRPLEKHKRNFTINWNYEEDSIFSYIALCGNQTTRHNDGGLNSEKSLFPNRYTRILV